MSKHMTIINLACTITKVRKWGEGWKHSAESAHAAFAELHRKHKEAERTIETLRANLTQTESECQAELAVVKDERDQLRVERDALRAQLDTERERHKQTATILAQYAPKTMQIEPPLEAERDEMKEEIKQANKEASDATARQRMTEVRALKYSAQAEDARREIERLRSEVESLRAKLTIHSDEMTALAAERDAHAAEVESLRAKIAAKTVQWPEWAKVGARVRVRSKDCMTTQQSDRHVGEELVISKVDRRDWTIRAESFGWVHVSDLEPVAEHVTPAVVSEQPIATQTRTQETAPVLPRVGDTVRLVKRPEMYGGEDRWSDVWGIVGQEGKMTENVHNIFLSEPYILVSTQGKGESVHRLREWPVSCIEVVK